MTMFSRQRIGVSLGQVPALPGGCIVSYTPDDHGGSRFVEPAVSTKEGIFLR